MQNSRTSQPYKKTQRRKQEHSYDLKRKGHKEQFEFNEGVEDRINAATKRTKRLALSEGGKKTVQEVARRFRLLPKGKNISV